MFGNETLDTVYVAIAGVLAITLLILMMIESFRCPKQKCLYMIVYHKRDLEEEDKEFAAGERGKVAQFAKTYQKAKKQAKIEIDGDLQYNSASIYLLNRSRGFIFKVAELGERGEKAVGEENA